MSQKPKTRTRRAAGNATGTGDPAELDELNNPTAAVEEGEVIEDDPELDAEPDLSPDVLPDSLVQTPAAPSDEPDPFAPKWRIVLHRNNDHGGTHRWKRVGEYTDERFAHWQTDPPIARVLKDHGPGYYRFDVKLGNDHLRIDAYPSIGGARMFTVDDPANPGAVNTSPTIGAAQNTNGNGNGTGQPAPLSLNLNHLVDRLLGKAIDGTGPNNGGGLTTTQAVEIARAIDTASTTATKLDRHLETIANRREQEIRDEHARDQKLSDFKHEIDKLAETVERAGKRDPLAEITQFQQHAKAMGYEQQGWIGVAERVVDGVMANGGLKMGGGAPGGQVQVGGGAPMKMPTNTNPAPATAPAQINGTDWKTMDDGCWLNVGEWAEWVIGKITRRQPTSTYLMADELVSRLLNDQRAAEWVKAATVQDLFELFQMVAPNVDAAQLAELRGEAQNILTMFPTRYAAAEQMLSELQAGKTPTETPATPIVNAPTTTLPPRKDTPPPPPPPPPAAA